MTIAIGTDDEWERFVKALGTPAWAEDRRFATVTGRYNNQIEIGEHIARWTLERDPYDIANLLARAHGVASGPVIFDKEAFSDPQYHARGFFEAGNPGRLWHTPLSRHHVEGVRHTPTRFVCRPADSANTMIMSTQISWDMTAKDPMLRMEIRWDISAPATQ